MVSVTGLGLTAADRKLFDFDVKICLVFIKRNTNSLH